VKEKLYKMLGPDGRSCNGGNALWSPPSGKRLGKWMPRVPVDPCRSGYHVCAAKHLFSWLGPAIWVVEVRGEVVDAGDKLVAEQARLVARTPWDERRARLFAADCAARVLPLYELDYPDDRPRLAIEAARKYARGEIDNAARNAAEDAAWAAARNAAEDAAWAAAGAPVAAAKAAALTVAWYAASAAWTVAWYAAENSARAAAWDAARAAERDWQTRRLIRYLQPTEPRPVPLPRRKK
jgi:hypothetical protein